MAITDDDLQTFHRRLRYAMDVRDMRAADLAESSGLCAATVREYVRGAHMPNARALAMMCRALAVSADYLLGLV